MTSTLKPLNLGAIIVGGVRAVPAATPAATTFKPLNFAPTILGTIAGQVSTSQKYAQAYTVQAYDEYGRVVTRTISLSKLQSEDQDFEEERVSNTEAKLLTDPTFSADKLKKCLQDSAKIDYFLCIKSKQSPVIEFNTLQTPDLDSDFVYNFYVPDEADIATQEDPDLDPFVKKETPPRYVSFNWQPLDTGNSSFRTKEENALVNTYLKNFRGVSTTANSSINNDFESSKKSVNPIFRDGKALSVTDTHDLPSAFNSITNSRVYKNSTMTVLNTNPVDVDKIKFDDVLLSKFNEK